MKSAVILALLASTDAVQLEFRPRPGTAPWHKAISRPSFEKPDFPTGYTVPNFGVDNDIRISKKNLVKAEKEVGHKLKATFDKPGPPADLRRPDYGVDSEIKSINQSLTAAEKKLKKKWNVKLLQLESDPICSSAGCTQYKHKSTPLGYPIDYPVPSFGADPDIEANHRSLSIAEAMHNHKLIMGTPESKAKWHNVAKDTMYNFAPDLDKDIVDTQSHLGIAEGIRQHKWNIANVQLDAELASDPICPSSGCWKSEYTKEVEKSIVQYPDPDE